ncbi:MULTISPECIES: hypothetical protein [unclassified Rhizobium]|uniref:hypothetical protein n=1 Tax=unclassified Rhizobium TaxID=2613769 RepID=UPI001ADA9DC5|nr:MULTISPECIES: hypothetical protein [unclassified Rhizobium]MBO9097568.1 hypothetical protein [Rhizobium sp. L58/93]MBO9168434.1 hypothetical protein [Rhizobium sp. L245/93]MBO9183767.1 hypothetical protein [Rhizobium sp. E27B/91]QXZ84575.1 hypothetical protein J5287_03280 [Rhizobium sp. K1/93]QXZ91285.1 hypothetical protein J5280_06720 [Rhizobium sp. K15/93]
MDPITKTAGAKDKLESHLAEMEARAMDGGPALLDAPRIDRQARLQALRDEVADLQETVAGIKARVARTRQQAVSVVKSGAEWADASAHAQLGSYPWAKLAGASVATFVGTRILRMLPLGGILSIAAPLIISQIKARNAKR